MKLTVNNIKNIDFANVTNEDITAFISSISTNFISWTYDYINNTAIIEADNINIELLKEYGDIMEY